jgi:hypothetical protein
MVTTILIILFAAGLAFSIGAAAALLLPTRNAKSGNCTAAE